MSTVSFPGLGLEFSLNRVAFTLLGYPVYWYGMILATGFLLGAAYCWTHAKQFGIVPDSLLDMLIFATPAGIVGARLYYVIFYLDRFRNADGSLDVPEMFNIHNGGIAVYGSIIAAALACYVVTHVKRIPFFAMADLCAFGLLIGQSVGRWGNFINVEAYGSETTLPWRMGITETVNGVAQHMEVHPTFLYESLWNLVGLCLLIWVMKKGLRCFDGMMFFMYVAWYGFGRGVIEGLRTDSLYLFSTGIRTSQLVGFLTAVAAVVFLMIRLRQHPDPAQMYVNQEHTVEKVEK